MEELKPCPFCGQDAIRSQNPGHNWDGKDKNLNVGACYGLWFVGCPSAIYDNLKCKIHPGAKWYANLEDAEEDWNRRK